MKMDNNSDIEDDNNVGAVYLKEWGLPESTINNFEDNVSPISMDTSPMRQNSYEPGLHEIPYHHQKWNQNTPSTSQTGCNLKFPWPEPIQNQSITHDIYACPLDMTHMIVTSPNNPFLSPDMLTQSRVTAPPRQDTLPQRQVMLPQNNLTSPQDQITLPEGQVNLPRRQVMSPQDHSASLQGQSQPDQIKSLYFTSHHMPHESVNVVQQSVEHSIETNSHPSILKLLTNGERTFNSGEIAAIIQDLRSDAKDGTEDLSDSFSQLLTVSDDLQN